MAFFREIPGIPGFWFLFQRKVVLSFYWSFFTLRPVGPTTSTNMVSTLEKTKAIRCHSKQVNWNH